MHPDFNLYDSHHEVTAHAHLKDGDWRETYMEAWRTFYSFENMKAVLRSGTRTNYWNNFLRFIWYKNSVVTEGRHPMMCGFFRLKGRKNRRPGYPILSRWAYYTSRAREIRRHLGCMFRLLVEMEELWLQTRHPSDAEQRVVEELAKIRAAYGRLSLADLQTAFKRVKDHYPALHVPSKLLLFWATWSRCSLPTRCTRVPTSPTSGAASSNVGGKEVGSGFPYTGLRSTCCATPSFLCCSFSTSHGPASSGRAFEETLPGRAQVDRCLSLPGKCEGLKCSRLVRGHRLLPYFRYVASQSRKVLYQSSLFCGFKIQ
jgi:hypothetical protein